MSFDNSREGSPLRALHFAALNNQEGKIAMRFRFSVGFLLVCFALAAGVRADRITLKNGDRVTGTIVKKDGATLTIDSAHFGKVTLPWDQVDTIATDVPAYVQVGGANDVGTFNLSGGQVTITPTSGAPRSVPAGEVQAIRNNAEQAAYERMLDPGLTDLWNGTANLGLAGTAGNARTKTFTFAGNATRPTMTDKTTVYFNAVSASALVGGTDTSTAKAVRGGWAYQRDIRPRIFGNVFNDYEFDRFQSLDLRFVLGAGAGFHAIVRERTKLDLLAGLDYARERFSTPLTRNSAEFSWGDEFNHKLNGTVTLLQSYRMFNNLNNTSNYRINFDFGAAARLAQWLTWNVTIGDRYLSNPLAGRQRNDVLYSTGLGLRFSR
jgi:hypothetical protein